MKSTLNEIRRPTSKEIEDLNKIFGMDTPHLLKQIAKILTNDYEKSFREIEESDRLTLDFERSICQLWVELKGQDTTELELFLLKRVKTKWGDNAVIVFDREKNTAWSIQKNNICMNMMTGDVSDVF